MSNELRQQLLSHCPRKVVTAFEKAIRDDVALQFQTRLNSADNRMLDLSNQCNIWRVKYLAEQERARELEHLLALKEAEIAERDERIGKQAAFIDWLQRQVFGETSERGASEPQPEPSPDAPSTQDTKPAGKPKRGKRRGTRGHGRKHDVGSDPPQEEKHDLDEKDKVCKCGEEFELTDLSPVESTETHYEEKVIVKKHLRRKAIRRCKKCGLFAGIKKARKPPQLIQRGKYSTGFWRAVIEEKYWLQRPIYRFCRKLKSLKCDARLGTLTNGLHILYDSRIFEVIYEEIVFRSRLANQRHMDETGWKIFESEKKDSPNWYMWVSKTVDTTVFILDPSKSHEVIEAHLKGAAEGIIISDRAKSFACFAKDKPGFIIAFCWVHQRRDFVKLKNGYPKHAGWAQEQLARIDALIAQNKVRLQAAATPDFFKLQDKILREMVESFKAAVDEQLNDKSLAEEQIGCLKSLVNHWSGLTVFVDRPHVPMSNNEAERALRNAVVGRKNYYGSRAEWSGMLAAQLFSIYATLEQNNIDPMRWMQEYLDACAENDGYPPKQKELEKFLPWNYKSSSTPVPAAEEPPAVTTNTGSSQLSEELSISVSIMAAELQPTPVAKPPP